jgi:hypothetical protein
LAAAAAEVGIAGHGLARTDILVPVDGHVVERRVGMDQPCAVESGDAQDEAVLDVGHERVIRGGLVVVGIDINVGLRKAAADDRAPITEGRT